MNTEQRCVFAAQQNTKSTVKVTSNTMQRKSESNRKPSVNQIKNGFENIFEYNFFCFVRSCLLFILSSSIFKFDCVKQLCARVHVLINRCVENAVLIPVCHFRQQTLFLSCLSVFTLLFSLMLLVECFYDHSAA